jgi:hypothetical protein
MASFAHSPGFQERVRISIDARELIVTLLGREKADDLLLKLWSAGFQVGPIKRKMNPETTL